MSLTLTFRNTKKPLHITDYDQTMLATNAQRPVITAANIMSALAYKILHADGHFTSAINTGRVTARTIGADNNRLGYLETEEHAYTIQLPYSLTPNSEIVAGGVGTEILLRQKDGTYEPDQIWENKITATGFRDTRSELEIDGQFNSELNLLIIQSLNGLDLQLEGQQAENNSPSKYSLWGTPVKDTQLSDVDLSDAINEALDKHGIDTQSLELTVSVQSKKIAVDFTPYGVNKESAAERIIELTGTPRDKVLATGDSGNDRKLLSTKGVLSGTPSGAQKENLVDAINLEKGEKHYHSANMDHAAGVIDSMRHFGFINGFKIMQAFSEAQNQFKSDFKDVHHLTGDGHEELKRFIRRTMGNDQADKAQKLKYN